MAIVWVIDWRKISIWQAQDFERKRAQNKPSGAEVMTDIVITKFNQSNKKHREI